jgi:hypothetical protein
MCQSENTACANRENDIIRCHGKNMSHVTIKYCGISLCYCPRGKVTIYLIDSHRAFFQQCSHGHTECTRKLHNMTSSSTTARWIRLSKHRKSGDFACQATILPRRWFVRQIVKLNHGTNFCHPKAHCDSASCASMHDFKRRRQRSSQIWFWPQSKCVMSNGRHINMAQNAAKEDSILPFWKRAFYCEWERGIRFFSAERKIGMPKNTVSLINRRFALYTLQANPKNDANDRSRHGKLKYWKRRLFRPTCVGFLHKLNRSYLGEKRQI